MPFRIAAQRTVGGTEEDDGNRTFTLVTLLESTWTNPLLQDGPYSVMACPLLPQPGNTWAFGAEQDTWAYCRRGKKVSIHQEKEGEPARMWRVEQTFSTKPPAVARCQDAPMGDPLQEPPQVSGGSVKFQREAAWDRFGNRICTSSHEAIKGPQVEFDANRGNRTVVLNVGTWDQVALAYMMLDTLNAYPLWGFPPRCVKLSTVRDEEKYYGQCYKYYRLTLEFENWVDVDEFGNYVSGFDRDLLDEGTKALNGRWNATTAQYEVLAVPGYTSTPNPNPLDPQHFKRFRDRNGDPCNVVLNGQGLPAGLAINGTAAITLAGPVLPGISTAVPVVRQPTTPTRLTVRVHDTFFPSNNLVIDTYTPVTGTLAITGRTAQGVLTGENIWVDSQSLDSTYTTRGSYRSITSVQWTLNPEFNAFEPPVAPNAGSTVTVTTNAYVSTQGKIHVEKYPDGDLLQLGIPAIL